MSKISIENIVAIMLILIYIIFTLVFLGGCDYITKCRPQANIKKGYVGFKCDGEF
jgi:hypothetical protein